MLKTPYFVDRNFSYNLGFGYVSLKKSKMASTKLPWSSKDKLRGCSTSSVISQTCSSCVSLWAWLRVAHFAITSKIQRIQMEHIYPIYSWKSELSFVSICFVEILDIFEVIAKMRYPDLTWFRYCGQCLTVRRQLRASCYLWRARRHAAQYSL